MLLCTIMTKDLIEKITVLRGYFKLSQMSPERNYSPIVRRAARELDGALRRHNSGSLRQREAQYGSSTFISADKHSTQGTQSLQTRREGRARTLQAEYTFGLNARPLQHS
jgi:hypothetical protein